MTDVKGDEVACHQLGEVLMTKCPRDGRYGLQVPKYRRGKDV